MVLKISFASMAHLIVHKHFLVQKNMLVTCLFIRICFLHKNMVSHKNVFVHRNMLVHRIMLVNIRKGQHPLVKIELKKILSFRGEKHNKNEKFLRDEYYCNIFDITSVTP